MKHKHYDMIVAKAANMELETFINQDGEWRLMVNAFPMSEHFEYFLCLPQHKDACLHWLNGGEVEVKRGNGRFRNYRVNSRGWYCDSIFYTGMFGVRIKPKKEKRLLAINGDQVSFASSLLCYPKETQFIEIEVEL